MLKRKKRLQAKKPLGRGKANKPRTERGNQKKEADIAKQRRYQEVCLLVDERDQGMCQAPGCNRRGTQHHHITTKAQGGADDVENLVLLCMEHHTGNEGPHMQRSWRRFWEGWREERYPDYARLKNKDGAAWIE